MTDLIETDFAPITELDEMITRDDAITVHPWLTAKKLKKWAKDGKIRSFTGGNRMPVFVKADIIDAINAELCACKKNAGNNGENGTNKKKEDPVGTDTGTTQTNARLEEENSRRKIFNLPKRN